MSSPIKIREYEEGDQHGIVELMRPHWPHFAVSGALTNWEWEYRRAPHESIVTVAEHGGRIVAHYSVLPMTMKFKHNTLLGAKAEGSAIHQDYRRREAVMFMEGGKDLFKELIQNTFERSEKKGVRLIWGFPNQRALHGQVRAGYTHITIPISRFVFPLDLRRVPRTLLSSFKGSSSLKKTLQAISTSIPKLVSFKEEPSDEGSVQLTEDLRGVEELWKYISKENDCVTLERTQDYLRWRVVDNPVVPHRVITLKRGNRVTAYISIAQRGSSEGSIVDMLVLKNTLEDLRILLYRGLALLKRESGYVTTWMTRNGFSAGYERMLRSVGFLELPESRMDMLVKTFDLPEEYFANIENWFITPIFAEGIS